MKDTLFMKMSCLRLSNKFIIALFTVFSVACIYRTTIFTLTKLYAFLSVTNPVNSEVIVIEGWLFDYMLDEAVKEIRTGNYKYIVTTGFVKYQSGNSSNNGIINSAEICKNKLIERGVKASAVYAVASPWTGTEHTLNTAVAIKSWLANRKLSAVNIFTGGPHGRKTLTVFQKVLGKDVKVGIISSKIKSYPSDSWWTSRRGTKATIKYLIGYIYYALFLDYR